VSLQQDATGKLCRPVKPKNQRHLKIDGIVAAIMGLSRLIANEDDSRCAYDDPEMSI
jgi:phage terminase large subunit-like protein